MQHEVLFVLKYILQNIPVFFLYLRYYVLDFIKTSLLDFFYLFSFPKLNYFFGLVSLNPLN